MNDVPLTFLKNVRVTEHVTMSENLLVLLSITLIGTLVLLSADEFEAKDIVPLCITGFITLILINLIPFERTDSQYMSKPLTIESISNTSEPNNKVVEVSDGKKSYIITDIKGLDKLEKNDHFYLKTTVASNKYEQKKIYMLNQFENGDTKIIKVKGK